MNESFVNTLFGKSIHELKWNDLILFFNTEKIESDKLEFKSYVDFENSNSTKSKRDKEKINDILKSLCAFLNSDGGILIWGAPEGRPIVDSKEKVCIGDLTPVKYKLEKDQFINRVASELSPIPHRILFHSITIDENSFCYIFEISKSEFAPHQYKGTYYMRLDGSTRPAPHHYVEALIKKISFPKIEAYLSFGEIITGSDYACLPMVLTIHNMSKFIQERNIEYRILCDKCNILDPNDTLIDKSLNSGCDIQNKAKAVLHFSMPYYNEFVMVTKRILPYSKAINITILLTIWGELSPAIISIYNLEIFGDIDSAQTKYCIKEKNENSYLYEKKEEFSDDRNEKSNSLIVESFQKRLHTFPLIKQLY